MPSSTNNPKILEALIGKVREAVANLTEVQLAGWQNEVPGFLASVFPPSTKDLSHNRTYSIGPDSEPVLHFKLRGHPARFPEHVSFFLGGWTGEGDTVTVPLYWGDDSGEKTDAGLMIEGHQQDLEDAIKDYSSQLEAAWEGLLSTAKKAIDGRRQIEPYLRGIDIQKRPSPRRKETT